MKNMKVAVKLISGFAIVALLTAIVGAVGIYGMSRLTEVGRQMYENNLLAAGAMGDIREAFQKERVYLRDMLIYIDAPDIVNESIKKLNETHLRGEEAVDRYMDAIIDESLEGAFMEAGALLDGPYLTAKEKIMQSAREGDAQGVLDGIDEAIVYVSTIEECLATSEKNHVTRAEEQYSANLKMSRVLAVVQIAIVVLACLVALLLGFYISGLISKPLHGLTGFMNRAGEVGDISLGQEDFEIINKYSCIQDEVGQCISSCAKFIERLLDVEKALETVADCDLTVKLALLSDKDAIGRSLDKMLYTLNDMFNDIDASVAQVSLGASQIADSAQAIAQGATEQASVVDQLSATIDQIAEKTKQNASMAKEAVDLSVVIKEKAEKGSEQMENMMGAVKEINDASTQIEKVIKAIDEIAFQTNILALNAAVEAARAGVAGKGFAVVAEEVRNLAAKSAEAAKDTGSLIEDSVTKANLGLNIALETSDSLKEIVDGINRNAEFVEQIARSSDGQAVAIAEINTGIDQVSQVIQQNSAAAEENAAASKQMSSQSHALSQLVLRFKLNSK